MARNKLLFKLGVVGVHPRIILWLKAFFTERSYQVRINSALSTSRLATSGVPQGGVLSPVLFNIYTFELPELLLSTAVSCCAFADDVKLYHSVTDAPSHDRLQSAVDLAQQWARSWGLPLSSTKSKLLRIGPGNNGAGYTVNGSRIEQVESVRDLGFLVNSSLTFDEHCKTIALNASRRVPNLFRALSTEIPTF